MSTVVSLFKFSTMTPFERESPGCRGWENVSTVVLIRICSPYPSVYTPCFICLAVTPTRIPHPPSSFFSPNRRAMSSATHDAVAVTAVTNRLQVRSLWYLNDVSTATRCRSTVPRIIWSLRRALSPTLLQTLSAFLSRRMLDDAAAGEVKYNERWELRRRMMRSCPQAISMHGGTMNRLCLVNICRDTGYRDLLHLACASVVYPDCCRVVRS